MINTVLLKKNSVDKNFVWGLSEFFYAGAGVDARTYEVNRKTGLNYFGEYLERHEDRDVSIFDVMAAVCMKDMNYTFPEQQIFDGQYDLFIERVEQKREQGFDFELELLYSMFLSKMDKEKASKEVLKEFIDKMNLDNYFLVLCCLVRKEYVKLDQECKNIIVEKLKNNKISIDVNELMTATENNYWSFLFESEHANLKFIISILELTKSDFKDAPEVFENLKYLKKVGTRDSLYEKAKDILDIKEDEFYLLALKLAADSYAIGSALVKTNDYLINKLEDTITANNDWYCNLPKLNLRVKGGTDNGQISLSKVDYSNIQDEYFGSMINAYGISYSRIAYNQIKDVCHKESFIEYMNSKKVSLSDDDKKLIMNVIEQDTDRTIVESFYEIIKECDRLRNNDICVFCSKKLVSAEYILDKIFEDNDGKLSIEYDGRTIIRACITSDVTEVLIEMIKRLNSNNVTLGLYVEDSLLSVLSFLEKKCFSNEFSDDFRKELLNVLYDFVFLYFSKNYKKFLLKYIDNEFVINALGIDEAELKNIAKYMLEKNNFDNDNVIKLKKIVLSDEDIFKENLKIKVNDYISYYADYNGRGGVNKNLVEFINNYHEKEIIRNHLREVVEEMGLGCNKDIEFMAVIRLIMATELLTDDEVMELIKERLFVAVV